MDIIRPASNVSKIIDVFFLAVLNIVLMSIIGYLTLDSEANLNSRVGALLISFFLPYFIVSKTRQMTGLEHLIKFGTGFIIYAVLGFSILDFHVPITTGLVPCLALALGVLFYGNKVMGEWT